MNLLVKYSDTIVKEIMKELTRSMRRRDKARDTEIALHLESNLHQSNYWKAQNTIEVETKHIQQLFDELSTLDKDTNWTGKLHQDRFAFVQKRYLGAYKTFREWRR